MSPNRINAKDAAVVYAGVVGRTTRNCNVLNNVND